MQKNNYLLGLALCLISTIFWGSQFPVMEPVLKVIDPFYFTLMRYGSVAIIFAILLLITEGKKAFHMDGHLLKLWLLGSSAIAGYSFLAFAGQKMAGNSGSIITSVLMAVQPLLAVLVARVYRGTRPTKVALLSMAVALIGVLLVVTNGNLSILTSGSHTLIAVVLILLGALCWVIYTTGGADFTDWSILRFSTLSTILGIGTVIVLLAIATAAGWLHIPTSNAVGSILPEWLYMVIPAGVIAVFTWNLGNRIVSPINGILFMNIVPVTSFIISAVIGYKVGSFEIIGAAIVISALIANNIYNRKHSS
ncbi:DMT family transporter [Lactococcus nasutitermitis]|uniref:DMT family transporter n=1 Tax=Lactococcus nasutitermitis TaxID=1652957 RepID=A0ABV9JE86_9LACT|nr:DMT family transporter [Lactococcus nasutitermitis]